jgi:FlaA1/EpsC-like NDP-sugar epimerase
MLSQHKKPLTTTFCVIDIFIIIVSFCVAYCLRFGWKELSIPGIPIQFLIFFLTYLIAWIYLSSRFKLYTSKRITSFWYETWDVCKTTAICILIATLPAFFIREHPLSRLFLSYLWPLQTGTLILFRYILRETLKYFRRRGYNFRQIIIVGRNERAKKIVKQIKENPEFGLRILGYIDAPGNGNNVASHHDLKLIGNLKDLEKILREQVVDEVFITLPLKSFYLEIEEIVHICEQVGVEVKISTDLFSLTLAKETISRFGDIHA